MRLREQFPTLLTLHTGHFQSIFDWAISWKRVFFVAESSKAYKPQSKVGIVAGWGLQTRQHCYTDAFGPSIHIPCAREAYFAKKIFKGCSKSPTPSKRNALCLSFEKNEKKIQKYDVIKILYKSKKNGKSSATKCFIERADHGWCGSCDKNAKEQTAGFCDHISGYGDSPENDRPARVKPGRGWGFCNVNCENKNHGKRADYLQETLQTVLDEKTCKIFDTDVLLYNPKSEICAGKKNKWPEVQVYEMKSPTKFEFVKNQTSRLGEKRKKAKKLPFYIGGSDSCNGDSGGPLFQIRSKFYLLEANVKNVM